MSKLFVQHSKRFPCVKQLAIVINNIPSSSAYIERYFSICGFVCSPRRANMKDDLMFVENKH